MIGTCEHCGGGFNLEIYHCGFGDDSYAYCDQCGRTAILSCWSKSWPKGVKCTQAEIESGMEAHLKKCDCGGKFVKGNSPRCPHCNNCLSAVRAADYIEPQSPGTKKGWRWQRNWSGTYCAVVEKLRVNDNFED